MVLLYSKYNIGDHMTYTTECTVDNAGNEHYNIQFVTSDNQRYYYATGFKNNELIKKIKETRKHVNIEGGFVISCHVVSDSSIVEVNK